MALTGGEPDGQQAAGRPAWPGPPYVEPSPGSGPGTATGTASPRLRHAARELREGLAAPEGQVAPTAQTIRPSLWAALEMFSRLVGQLAPLLVPALFTVFAVRVEANEGPWWAVLFERFDLAVGLLAVAAPVVRVAFTRYTLDDEGIRVRSVLLSKNDQRVPWDKVTAVRHRRTLLGALVGIQRVEVVAYGSRGTTLQLVGLRDAPAIRDLVARRMRSTASVEALLRND